MKAAVYHGVHDLRVEEVPDKKPGDDEVLIAVRYCGVCGTDMHIYNGEGGAFAVHPPLIPGHEFSGIVAEVGKNVTSVKAGDRVTGDPNDMCGGCYYCKNGMEQFCTENIGIGTTVDGGFAQYVSIREKQVYKIPEGVDLLEAAMTEPLSCCIHGIDRCHIRPGSSVLVMGGGPIGLIMMQLAKNAGASVVILTEPARSRRETALALGATMVIDPLCEDTEGILRECCPNVDVVIECVGNVHTQAEAVKLAGRGATIMYFGLASPEESFSVKPDDIFKKELTITSSFINPYTFSRALGVMASGSIRLKELIANVIPLDQITEVFAHPEKVRSGKTVIEIS